MLAFAPEPAPPVPPVLMPGVPEIGVPPCVIPSAAPHAAQVRAPGEFLCPQTAHCIAKAHRSGARQPPNFFGRKAVAGVIADRRGFYSFCLEAELHCFRSAN